MKFEYNILNYVVAIYLINHKPKFESDQDLKDAKVNSCLQRVTEILGFELAKDVVTGHLINNEFNIDKTVDQILNTKTGTFNLKSCTYLYINKNNNIITIFILQNIGAPIIKDLQGNEIRLNRPPSVVIASSSKNKDNIIIGFGNATISGSVYVYLNVILLF